MACIKLNDRDIRAHLWGFVARERAADDLMMIEEVQIERGRTRIDLLAVNSAIHGYEIKSDRDTLVRLNRQVRSYNRVTNTMTLVVGERYVEPATQIVPKWWGIITAHPDGSLVRLERVRECKPNPSLKLDRQVIFATVDDLKRFASSQGVKAAWKMTRYRLIAELLRRIEAGEMTTALMERCIRDSLRQLPTKRAEFAAKAA
jgi:hypothetical protein